MADRSEAQRRGLAVGLTGGIACGKSTVAKILAGEGAAVRDSDEIAHEMIAKGGLAYEAVVARFGSKIVGDDGEIDRKTLGNIVFTDPVGRADLEKMIHPGVKTELGKWTREVTAGGRDAVAIVPLLYEVNVTDLWDAVICVTAEDSQVLQRLFGRGLAEEEARRRIAAQMPVSEKAARADYVIENNGSLETLAEITKRIWKELLRKESSKHG